MTGLVALFIVLIYFGVLLFISYLTGRGSSDKSFFTGDRNSPWYVVAFGMIGATLSGITFISVPGSVYNDGMSYMPMVIGFLFGYIIISFVLIPLYYKLNLTSIYGYLKTRFGRVSFKTGAIFFLISRTVGASLRLFLAAEVLDVFLFTPLGVPYALGVVFTICLIWVYTFKSGIKTIVWTDALQTACLLIAMVATVYFIKDDMGLSVSGLYEVIANSEFASFVGGKKHGGPVLLSVFNGLLMAVVMTGLDQDMMQKSLTCKNPADAKKNMIWLGVILIPVNLLFLSLGVLMFENYLGNGLTVINGDDSIFQIMDGASKVELQADRIYPTLAKMGYFPLWLSGTFLIGLVAAAYSSADSALTSLTTSFCVDIIEKDDKVSRTKVHIGMSVLVILVVLLFKLINNESVVRLLFSWAGFTYGPLLGLFSFGIFTKYSIKDKFVPLVALACVLISIYLKGILGLGHEVLALNGMLMFLGLYLIRTKDRIKL